MELEIWISHNYIWVLYKSPTECNKCDSLWFLLTAVYSLTWKTEKSMKETICLLLSCQQVSKSDRLFRTAEDFFPTCSYSSLESSPLFWQLHSTTLSCAKRDRDQSDIKSKMVTWNKVIKWSLVRHSNHKHLCTWHQSIGIYKANTSIIEM